jgi:hypothetical protein
VFVQAILAYAAKIDTQNAIFRRQAALAERIYTPIIFYGGFLWVKCPKKFYFCS